MFCGGLLIGAMFIERIVRNVGHRKAFIGCLAAFSLTIVAYNIPEWPGLARCAFIAGVAVAGVFVIVESWFDVGRRASRANAYYTCFLCCGGSALGQFGIGVLGVVAAYPLFTITTLILMAMLVLMFIDCEQPNSHESTSLSFKQIAKLNHAAIIGCVISGLTNGLRFTALCLLNWRTVPTDIGTLMALVILGGMLVQPMVTTLNKYRAERFFNGVFYYFGYFLYRFDVHLYVYRSVGVAFPIGHGHVCSYPVAINLGCEGLDERFIVSATQVGCLATA